MALIRCGASTGLKETVLWTNSTPTSAQNGGSITMSDNMSNYDMIKLTFRTSTTSADGYSIYCDDITKAVTNGTRLSCDVFNTGNNGLYSRGITYTDDTTLNITYAGRVDATGSDNNLAILTEVAGVKI